MINIFLSKTFTIRTISEINLESTLARGLFQCDYINRVIRLSLTLLMLIKVETRMLCNI